MLLVFENVLDTSAGWKAEEPGMSVNPSGACKLRTAGGGLRFSFVNMNMEGEGGTH